MGDPSNSVCLYCNKAILTPKKQKYCSFICAIKDPAEKTVIYGFILIFCLRGLNTYLSLPYTMYLFVLVIGIGIICLGLFSFFLKIKSEPEKVSTKLLGLNLGLSVMMFILGLVLEYWVYTIVYPDPDQPVKFLYRLGWESVERMTAMSYISFITAIPMFLCGILIILIFLLRKSYIRNYRGNDKKQHLAG